MKSVAQRPPRFFWQGVLILLPVAVLAGAGFLSLRQDRVLARLEAREKAQALAEDGARVLWSKLTDPSSVQEFKEHSFRIDAEGRLVFPPPGASLPVPVSADLSPLNAAQRADWLASQAFATIGDERTTGIAACRRLIESKPPEPFMAATQFRLGQLLDLVEDYDGAGGAFRFVTEQSPSVMSESGIALGVLAELKLLELSARNSSASNAALTTQLWTFCSNTVYRPTFLTPRLLGRAAEIEAATGGTNIVAAWRENWANQESLRALAKAALAGHRDTAVPELFWFVAADDSANPQALFPPAKTLVGASRRTRPSSRNILAGITISNQTTLREPLPPETRQRAGLNFPGPVPIQWLAARVEDGTNGGFWIVCRAMEMITSSRSGTTPASPAWIALRESLPVLPDWFDVSVEAAGVTIIPGDDARDVSYLPAGKGGGQTWQPRLMRGTPEVLASARRGTPPEAALRVNIRLVSPEKLFVRQQARTRIFGTLIAVAAAAALIGFVSARRAFLRQQQLSEMKSNFVSSVSHELRAPIASVRLMAESLDRGKISEPAKQREYFRFIVQECRRLGTLIENVLDFARIEQGRKEYEFEPVDLTALVQQTVKLMEPAASERNVTLESSLPTSPLTHHASVDASAIQQALVNLIDNALKHSPPQSTVIVALVFIPHTSNLTLSVSDHGPGIPPEEHEKIFERFYRRGSELRRETPGVGIGLSIVKHILEAHGGRVRVESETGRGSRFVMELPCVPMTVEAQSSKLKAQENEQ